jgi:hypothetical protein
MSPEAQSDLIVLVAAIVALTGSFAVALRAIFYWRSRSRRRVTARSLQRTKASRFS